MWPSATPATWNEGGCHQVLRLPRKVPRRHRRPRPPQARHQSQPSAVSATPATRNEGACRQVPRLCHACHSKYRTCERWCVTKLYVKDGVCERWCVTNGVWKMVGNKVVCERWCVTKLCVKDGVWQCVRGGGGGGGGRGGGIQNQKQEPHTKMWGKMINFLQSRHSSRPQMVDFSQFWRGDFNF